MMLQAAVNGDRSKADHPAVPVTEDELIRDVQQCLAAGAQEFHIHVRDIHGNPTLEPGYVDRAASAVRATGAQAAGVTTVADIEPNLQRRLTLISKWTQPAYSSVNLCEDGAVQVMQALLSAGIGIEAGVWTTEDAETLVTCGLADRLTRILVEPGEAQVGKADAVPLASAIHEILDRAEVEVPRLQHGDGEVTWILIEDAVRRGLDTRVGLEDTLYLPDGSRARSNADLVAAARDLGAGTGRSGPSSPVGVTGRSATRRAGR
ncbi:MAG TPA: 3-keto-5-aminohexanoate cleavage protein [Streptosporangiaceae bacterium]|jgi:uncharacterized protein (DUF849 family)|nr:3-keto-5-aminohexanoate cleavage protein [Streptosporangiaceae bacterium]